MWKAAPFPFTTGSWMPLVGVKRNRIQQPAVVAAVITVFDARRVFEDSCQVVKAFQKICGRNLLAFGPVTAHPDLGAVARLIADISDFLPPIFSRI